MRKTLSIISTIIVLLIFLVTVLFISVSVMSYISKKPFKVFGVAYGVVETNSMHPMIRPGDFVLIGEQPFETYEIGDVIAFTSVSDVTIVHQIIDITEFGFETKGTNNIISDLEQEGYITEDRVLGKITYYGGHEFGAILLGSRADIIGVVVILIGIFFVIQIVGLVKQMKEKQKAAYQTDLEKLKAEIKKELEKTED